VASDLVDALRQPPIVAALALLATLLLLRLVLVLASGS
jgi:hypothetical protein